MKDAMRMIMEHGVLLSDKDRQECGRVSKVRKKAFEFEWESRLEI